MKTSYPTAALLAAALTAGFAPAPAAEAEILTFDWTFAGGEIYNADGTLYGGFAGAAVAQVVEFTYDNMAVTTDSANGDWGSEFLVGFESVDGPVVIAPFAGEDTSGSFGPSGSETFDLTGSSFYLPVSGMVDFYAASDWSGSSVAGNVINSGSLQLKVDTESVLDADPPTATDLGLVTLGSPASASDTLDAASVLWYSFDLDAASVVEISTAGSTNTGGSFGENDTELGLYDSDGNLLATNDDEDFGGGILTSLIVEGLDPGTYYVASGSFNTTYGGLFQASSDSTATGTSLLSVTVVPEPASLALLAAGGLLIGGRRRRA